MKTNALGKSRPISKQDMIRSIRSHLHRRQKEPNVRNDSGKYGTGKASHAEEARYRATFERTAGPFMNRWSSAGYCRDHALCTPPMNLKLMHWKACQLCPHRPAQPGRHKESSS